MVKSTNFSISVVFPCYNDKGTIASMVLEAKKTAEKMTADFEIIVVDDYSSDGSQELLLELKNSMPELKTVFHHKSQGYGSSLRSGFAAATKDVICYTDGDAQYDIREMPKLLEQLGDKTSIVSGYKVRSNDPYHRVVISAIYQYLMRFLFRLPIKDPDCDFRLMRRGLLESVNLTSDSGIISIELLKKAQNVGFVFGQVGVSHSFRMYGKSQALNFVRIAIVIRRLASLWIETVWQSGR